MEEMKNADAKIFFNIDLKYFEKIKNWILSAKDHTIFEIEPLTDTPVKFVYHLKFYIDNRSYIENYKDVAFNSDYTKIIVGTDLSKWIGDYWKN